MTYTFEAQELHRNPESETKVQLYKHHGSKTQDLHKYPK